MLIKSIQVGMLETNCYFLIDEGSKKTIIIDPGDEADKIISFIEDEKLVPQMILLTHLHYDHVTALPEIKAKYNIPVYAYEKGLSDNGVIKFLDTELEILYTPGHEPSSICIYGKRDNFIFTGDTLFYQNVGRWDLSGGNLEQLKNSLRKLIELPYNTIVYPGHGPSTNLKESREYLKNWL